MYLRTNILYTLKNIVHNFRLFSRIYVYGENTFAIFIKSSQITLADFELLYSVDLMCKFSSNNINGLK